MLDIQKLADLARMDVPKEEQDALLGDLDTIIAFVDQVKSREIQREITVSERINIFREDRIEPLTSAGDLVAMSPSAHDGFIKVPKVIE